MAMWAWNNPKVIRPGLALLWELCDNYRRHGVVQGGRKAWCTKVPLTPLDRVVVTTDKSSSSSSSSNSGNITDHHG